MTEIINNEVGSSVRNKLNTALNKLDSVTVDGSGNLTISPGLTIGSGPTITSVSSDAVGSGSNTLMTMGAIRDYAKGTRYASPNGYQILPSGLILQWGRESVNLDEDVPFSVNFSIPFPATCYNIQTTINIDQGSQMNAFGIYVKTFSTSGFTAQVASDSSVSYGTGLCLWTAIGL